MMCQSEKTALNNGRRRNEGSVRRAGSDGLSLSAGGSVLTNSILTPRKGEEGDSSTKLSQLRQMA